MVIAITPDQPKPSSGRLQTDIAVLFILAVSRIVLYCISMNDLTRALSQYPQTPTEVKAPIAVGGGASIAGPMDPDLPPRLVPIAEFDAANYNAVQITNDTDAYPIVASCPHAGRDYPAEFTTLATVDIDALRGLEDFGVDQLLPGFIDHGITCITSNVARAYLDVNRSADALDRSMFAGLMPSAVESRHVRAGYGLIPRLTAERQSIYNNRLAATTATKRIAAVHTPYHELLAAKMTEVSRRHGYALLVDFHSMPANDSNNKPLPDIILGDCNGMTLDRRIGLTIAGFFTDFGLSVGWNNPYSGGFITRNNGKLNSTQQSLQIEISRRLYMSADGRKMDVERTAEMTALLGAFGAYLTRLHEDGLLRSQ